MHANLRPVPKVPLPVSVVLVISAIASPAARPVPSEQFVQRHDLLGALDVDDYDLHITTVRSHLDELRLDELGERRS